MANEIKIGKTGSTALRVFDALLEEMEKRTALMTPKHGETAPTKNADFVGQFYIDTETKTTYIAVATESDPAIGDWQELENAE